MADEVYEADVEALLEAAGFAPAPIDVAGAEEHSLDVGRLRRHLRALSGAPARCDGLERERAERAERAEQEQE